MTCHGTVMKLFSLNASVGTERSDNKILISNPISVTKKLFQLPALQ